MGTKFLYKNSFLSAIVFVFFLSNLTVAVTYGQVTGPDKFFTIEKIEPSDRHDTVDLRFTANCQIYVFQDKLKVFPPVELSWSESKMVNNTLNLKGKFRRGEHYAIFIPDDTYCAGYNYKETATTFQMPERLPSVEFAMPGTVIERDSRQMVHTKVTNVKQLQFKGMRIPVLLVPYALEELKKKNVSLETVQEVLTTRHRQLTAGLGSVAELKPYLSEIFTEQQVFFPEVRRNAALLFSVPVSFRKDNEKGALEIMQFVGEDFSTNQKVTSPARLFRITDLSLTYKQSKNALLVWVTSIAKGKPAADVSVLAFNRRSGAVVILGETDSDGVVFVRNGDVKKQYVTETGSAQESPLSVEDIAFIFAGSSSDVSYIVVKKGGNVRPDWIAFDTEKDGAQLKKAHVFTERGIYRPGETVNFKGTIREYRDGTIRPPQGLTVGIEIFDSKGELALEKTAQLTEFGTFWDVFETKSYSTLGTYTLNVKWDNQVYASRSFEVQEFRPPRHFVETQCRHETKADPLYVNTQRQEHLLQCNVTGKYYAGGPVKHGKVRWKVYLTGTDFAISEYPDYSFGHALKQEEKELLESGESMLDEKGNLTVTLPMSTEVVTGVDGLEVVAAVVDFDGRAATGTTMYQEEPLYKVGISRHEEQVRAAEPQKLRVIVVEPEGAKVLNGRLEAVVLQQDWLYTQKRNEEGDAYWEGSWAWRKQFSANLDIQDGAALFDFDFMNGGDYAVKFTFTAADGSVFASTTSFIVEGYFEGYGYENRNRNFEKMFLASDRKSYPPGEDIKVFISPHRKISSLLMTLERDDLLEYQVISDENLTEITAFKAMETYAPNVYLTCLGAAAREDFPVNTGQFDNLSPTFLYGAASIGINKEPEKLVVQINGNETALKYEPGEVVKLSLSVTDEHGQGVESETALCVVDESILNMTRFQTPTLESLTKFTLPDSVYTGDLRTALLKQTPFRLLTLAPLTGGSGLSALEGVSTTKFRKDFRPVAYYSPAVVTDSSGKAEVTFTLPDTMTLYRVYAVSGDKTGRFASEEKGLTVVKDFYLEPGLPAFFTKGDRFTFDISAFNKTDKPGEVLVAAESDPQVSLRLSEASNTIRDYDRILIPVEGEAAKAGQARVAFKGSFDSRSDAVELKVPVNSGYILWQEIQFGKVRDMTTIAFSFPDAIAAANLNPEEVVVNLTVSGSPFLRMAKAIEYLLHYPYGCVEQTSSGIIPLAGLRKLIQQGLIPGVTVEQTDKYLKQGIERLFSMQTESGGFAYWPGNTNPDQWGTIYAIYALSHAKEAGYEFDQALMAKAVKYLNEALKEEMKKGLAQRSKTFTGYAAYLLSLNKALEQEQFTALLQDINAIPREAALLILMAGKRSGFASEQELSASAYQVLTQPSPAKEETDYHALYREPAIALLACAELLPDNPLVSTLAASLLGGINSQGTWTSTSDTGWSLIALGAYFSGFPFDTKPANVTVKQDGQPDRQSQADPQLGYTFTLNSQAFLKKPELTLSSDKPLMYRFSVTFPREDFARQGFSNGFTLHKSVQNTDSTDTIKLGDVVKVTVTIDADNDNNRYVVMDDPLPAGLVAINSAIATEEPVGAPESGSYWNEWDFEGGFYRFVPSYFEIRDDRVVVFKDWVWKGRYQYSYFARAVCEGTFVMPATKIQLMYYPQTVAYTPVGQLVIHGRQ